MKTLAKKLTALMLALFMLLLAGCGDSGEATSSKKASSGAEKEPTSSVSSEVESEEPVVPEVNDYSERTYDMVDILDYLKIDGRWAETTTGADAGLKPCISFDNTAQLLAFNADCEGDVTLAMTNKFDATEGKNERYYLVEVDGVSKRVGLSGLVGVEAKTTLTLATGLERGNHTFKIYRQTELSNGYDNIVSVTMKGVPTQRPADSDLYIEFFGDSITAGYGDLTTRDDNDNPSYPDKSSGTDTYAFKTAQSLGADISVVARSGLAYSYGLGGMPIEDFWKNISYGRSGLGEYKAERQPDVVVINLGTNDHNNYQDHGLTLDDMYNDALDLLKMVRADRPDAKIVWYYGMMGSNLSEQIQKAVKDAGGESAGLYFLAGTSNFDGGGYHPDAAGHEKAAQKLADFIKGII